MELYALCDHSLKNRVGTSSFWWMGQPKVDHGWGHMGETCRGKPSTPSGHSELLKAKLEEAKRVLGPLPPPLGDVLKVLTLYKMMHSYMLSCFSSSLPRANTRCWHLQGPSQWKVMPREEVEV